jgi:hypothetical protein
MKMPAYVPFRHLLIAISVALIWAIASPAQDYVRDSRPKFLSYDELVQLSCTIEIIAVPNVLPDRNRRPTPQLSLGI